MITWKELALGAVALLIPMGAYIFVGLENRVDDQSKQIAKISKQIDIVVSILSMKMPEVNVPALVAIAAQKNVSAEKITEALPLLSRDPAQAKIYLKSQMQFNEKEIDLIMRPQVN